jgi:hypothetical protein
LSGFVVVVHGAVVKETSSDESENDDSRLGRNGWGEDEESLLSTSSSGAVTVTVLLLVGEVEVEDDAADADAIIGGGSASTECAGNRCLGAIGFRCM